MSCDESGELVSLLAFANEREAVIAAVRAERDQLRAEVERLTKVKEAYQGRAKEHAERAEKAEVELKRYKAAVDAQPWGTDEPTKVLLDRVTRQWGDAKRGVNALNNLLRRVGWGQGEIDSAATLEEESERLQKAFCWALDYPKEFAATVSRLCWGPDAGKNMELAVTTILKEMK